MLRKGGNISAQLPPWQTYPPPTPPFSSALSKVSFRKVLPWPSRHRENEVQWECAQLVGPDNFADTWELQMLPRASSLLNVSGKLLDALLFLSFSSLLLLLYLPLFSPLVLLLLTSLSSFLFSRPSRRHRGMLKLANSGCANFLSRVERGWKSEFFPPCCFRSIISMLTVIS